MVSTRTPLDSPHSQKMLFPNTIELESLGTHLFDRLLRRLAHVKTKIAYQMEHFGAWIVVVGPLVSSGANAKKYHFFVVSMLRPPSL